MQKDAIVSRISSVVMGWGLDHLIFLLIFDKVSPMYANKNGVVIRKESVNT